MVTSGYLLDIAPPAIDKSTSSATFFRSIQTCHGEGIQHQESRADSGGEKKALPRCLAGPVSAGEAATNLNAVPLSLMIRGAVSNLKCRPAESHDSRGGFQY